MKNSRVFIIATICFMTLFFTQIFAQSSKDNTVPVTVITALKQKYPGAEIKSWKMKGGMFTAKVEITGKKYFIAFDKNGNWLTTASKISMPWGLSTTIRAAYKKSRYGTWHIYVSKKVESPAGEFYELMVDNTELIRSYPSTDLIETDKLLKFKANGTLADVTDISADPTLHMN